MPWLLYTSACSQGGETVTPTVPPTPQPISVSAPGNIARVWANEGGDKVTRDELRAVDDPDAVHNSVWDGVGISLFGARNEVVAFNLVLEAPEAEAKSVVVTLGELVGPDGATIASRPASGDDLANTVGRNIELFYVRYLEIKGLSTDLAYGNHWDERRLPERCQRPHDPTEASGEGGWEDRPCHNKFYPDIAVPLELHTPFSIAAGSNQSIWGDIYIPKTASAGIYSGTIEVAEEDTLTWQIPIRLRVREFELPDLPRAKTMLYISGENIADRYLGEDLWYPDPGTAVYTQLLHMLDRHFQLAHRHKISLIDGYTPIERMGDAWLARLNGDLFTPERGYDGPGVGVGNNVYSIATYGGWPWQEGTEEDMWANADAWVNWFDAHPFDTPTDYFLYLIDESADLRQTEEWSRWMQDNPGPGRRLMSMATIPLHKAVQETPSLDIPASAVSSSEGSEGGMDDGYDAAVWASAAQAYTANSSQRFYMYNGARPASGSFATEDDGVSLRELAWGQYKKGIDRWFYWEATYYDNFQGTTGQTNVFQRALTFGSPVRGINDVFGESCWHAYGNYFNGDGVLIYPGTDTRYSEDSYGVQFPFASLRLKHWRRGIQDVDYLALAAAVDPERTAKIVVRIVPRVLWEYGEHVPEVPEWAYASVSWSTDPDVWEAARAELADIIEGK
jgi:hypothetical protein